MAVLTCQCLLYSCTLSTFPFVSRLTSTRHIHVSRDDVTANHRQTSETSTPIHTTQTLSVTSYISLATCHMHCVNVRPCPQHLTNPSHFAGLRRTKTPRAAQALQLPPVASAFRWDVTFFNLFIHPLHVSLSPLLVF